MHVTWYSGVFTTPSTRIMSATEHVHIHCHTHPKCLFSPRFATAFTASSQPHRMIKTV
jgi:hypothetical protein